MQITHKLNLKTTAILLKVLLIILCIGYFAAHGLPQSFMLWMWVILWFVAPMVNLFYIFKNKKTR